MTKLIHRIANVVLNENNQSNTTKLHLLERVMRQILRIPGFHYLGSALRKLVAVLEPVGQVTMVNSLAAAMSGDTEGITVISANLCHDWPRHRRLLPRLEAFAALVDRERADLLLLQEVARTPGFFADDWLAERLGMAYIYARANGHRQIGFEEGLAILSRFPLEDPQVIELNQGKDLFVHRLALTANVKSPGGDILAGSVHLSLRTKRNKRQIASLHKWVEGAARRRMVLVGGDFNASEDSQQIKRTQALWLDTFRTKRPDQDGATHGLEGVLGFISGKRRIDYIFMHPGKESWKVMDAQHLTTQNLRHSDHLAVMTRLSNVE